MLVFTALDRYNLYHIGAILFGEFRFRNVYLQYKIKNNINNKRSWQY